MITHIRSIGFSVLRSSGWAQTKADQVRSLRKSESQLSLKSALHRQKVETEGSEPFAYFNERADGAVLSVDRANTCVKSTGFYRSIR